MDNLIGSAKYLAEFEVCRLYLPDPSFPRAILKAIRAGDGFGSGTETKIIHAWCIRFELLSDVIQQEVYTKYNPKEELRFAITIVKDQRSLVCGEKAYRTDKQHLTLIQ